MDLVTRLTFLFSALGSDHPPQSVHEAVEEEYVSYEQPKRKLKVPPPTPRRSEL